MYFDSADIYIESQTSLDAKIAAIEAVINAMISQLLKSAATATKAEYMFNDGQTTIKNTYRSPAEVAKAIKEFKSIKDMYVAQKNGRVQRLVDSRNFYNPFGRY